MEFAGKFFMICAFSIFGTSSEVLTDESSFVRGNSLEINEKDGSEFSGEKYLDVKLKTKKIFTSPLIEFELKGNGNFQPENSLELKLLETSAVKYLEELLTKLKGNEFVKIKDVKISKADIADFMRFKVSAECSKNDDKRVLKTKAQCDLIVKKVSKEFSVNELFIYFHEIGYSAEVNPGLKYIRIICDRRRYLILFSRSRTACATARRRWILLC